MRQADVQIGSTYMCYIGTDLAYVVVTGKVEGYVLAGRRVSDRFRVRRVGEDKDLPKPRTAAALRPSTDRRVWCKNPTPTIGDTDMPAHPTITSKLCHCGSGRTFEHCHGLPCPCGSGRTLKECCGLFPDPITE